ncbi:MAG: DUF1566 domain-containing protein [Leptospiraceae bacterium]|nr:DUF1566 domain-containing protein [Leptospiraceae bacterium]
MLFKIQILFLFLLTLHLNSAPFTDNGDGTVKDNATGLVWQKCSIGQTYTNSTCSGAATTELAGNAIYYCGLSSLASRGWRMPNMNEIRSIVDYSKSTSPMIDTAVFPNTVSGIYWSSTTPQTLGTRCYISFITGLVQCTFTGLSYYYRCVSGP